jgi:transcriptional regulator with XRE-family HTH domain
MEQRRRIRPANLAKKLRQIRLVLGLSQSELLRRLDAEELMHYGRISDYELGKREPALWILLAYARLAGIHLEYLVDDNLSLPTDLPGNVVYSQTKPTHRRK